MTTRHASYRRLALATGVLSILILFGCAAQKPIWGDRDSGLLLTYRLAEGDSRQYQNALTVTQDLAAIGQKTVIKTDMGFTVLGKAQAAENLVLGVTIDKLKVDISATQGNTSPDTGGIPGKGFDMTLSPQGKELDVAGAAALTYATSPFTKANLEPVFVRVFPDLPSGPVTVGDTWTSINDTSSDDGSTKINTVIENVNVLEGFETVDGLECAKISKKMAGTIKGSGNQMGSEFTMNGTIEGGATWYFAYKEGVFVSQAMRFGGDVKIESAMGSLPMTLETTDEIRLIQ